MSPSVQWMTQPDLIPHNLYLAKPWTVALSLPEKVTLVRPLHSVNAEYPMLVTLDGIVTDVSPQYANAHYPMLVTPSGIVTDVRPLHSVNALDPMLVTLSGIVTDVRPLQPRNVSFPMLVTLDGIVTDVSPLQPENA